MSEELAQKSLGEQFLQFLKNYLSWFNRISLLFDVRKSCVFQIFLLRSIKASLCPNIINFDSVDFSGRHPEEVISFFWRSVYVMLCYGNILKYSRIFKKSHVSCRVLGLMLASLNKQCIGFALLQCTIDATANTIFLHRGRAFPRKRRKPVDKQASGPHTNTLGREIKSPI